MMINIEKIKHITRELAKDPEHFLIENYYGSKVPKGFRIELYLAKKFRIAYNNFKQFERLSFEVAESWVEKEKMKRILPIKKLRGFITNHVLTKHPKDVFCRYCEKRVIPKRLHKLDIGDIVLVLLTAGFWAILIFFIYLFTRRCPYCNHSLRGMKTQSEENRVKRN